MFIIPKSVSDCPTKPEEVNLKMKRKLSVVPKSVSNIQYLIRVQMYFPALYPFLVFRDYDRYPVTVSVPGWCHSRL